MALYVNYQIFGDIPRYGTYAISRSGTSINTSVNMGKVNRASANDDRFAWKQTLQRNDNGTWVNLQTKTGWVSGNSPSHRTFSGVTQRGRRHRVKLEWTRLVGDLTSNGTWHGNVMYTQSVNH